MGKLRVAAIMVAVSLTVGIGAQHLGHAAKASPESAHPVYLKTGVLRPQRGGAVQTASQSADPTLYVVQLDHHPTAADKRRLKDAGAELGSYLPEDSYLARLTPAAHERVLNLPGVAGTARYTANLKLDPALQGAQGEVLVRVTGFGLSTQRALNQATTLGAQVQDQAGDAFLIRADATKLGDLTASEDVVYVEPVNTNFVLFNDRAVGVIGTDAVWQSGLDGKGQVVAVADTGLDTGKDATMHPDLKGQSKSIIALGRQGDASDTDGHGTHVAGSVVGTGAASNGQIKGMAPGARLVFQSVLDAKGGLGGIPDDIGQLLSQSYDAGARIASNSWGVPVSQGGGGVYDAQAQSVDKFLWAHPDMTVLFAAGNDGGGSSGSGPTQYDTVSTPSTAKNVITVGASQNDRKEQGKYGSDINAIAPFSSRGVTKDGRLKPDVVAPGTWVLSTKSSVAPDDHYWKVQDKNYAFNGGTSMATPITAGATALVRQYLVDKLGVENPRGSLLKAMLINGTDDLGIDRRDQGWGRINLKTTLLADSPRKLELDNESVDLQTGKNQTYTYTVGTGVPLKVSLVWTDYPADPAAAKTLVNDLDLAVTGPDGKALLGNGPENNGQADRTNNVENVIVKSPAAGTYTVTVKGNNVPQGPQRFALVVSGDVTKGGDNPNPPPTDPNPQPGAPSVSITSPAAGTTVSGTVTVSADAQAEAGVASVEFFADGRSLGKDSKAPWQANWDTTKVADGPHSLSAKVTDKAGASADATAVGVTVKNAQTTPPPPATGSLTSVFTGQVWGAYDYRAYYVQVDKAGPVSATLGWSEASASLAVYAEDPQGTIVANSEGQGTPAKIEFNAAGTGIYTFWVVDRNLASDFNLTVDYPDGGRTARKHLEGKVAALGQNERDYTIRMTRAGVLNATLSWADATNDLDLYLIDRWGNMITHATSGNLDPETLSARLSPGTYTLAVVASAGASGYGLDLTLPSS